MRHITYFHDRKNRGSIVMEWTGGRGERSICEEELSPNRLLALEKLLSLSTLRVVRFGKMSVTFESDDRVVRLIEAIVDTRLTRRRMEKVAACRDLESLYSFFSIDSLVEK